jgi:peptide/nickel transport system permease protein
MSTAQATANTQIKKPAKRYGFFRDVLKRLFKEKPLGVIGLFIVIFLFFVGIFAPFLAPEKHTENARGYNIIHLADRFTPPFTNPKYLLGTDQLGRDIFSRVIYGAQLSMVVAVVGTVLQTIISLTIGVACAYFGGLFDLLVQRFVDAWVTFPGLVLLITAMAIVGPGLTQSLLILGMSGGSDATRF